MELSGEAPVPPVSPEDEHDVGVSFRNAGSDGADAHFGDKLDGDAGFRIHILEVVDELGEIFD